MRSIRSGTDRSITPFRTNGQPSGRSTCWPCWRRRGWRSTAIWRAPGTGIGRRLRASYHFGLRGNQTHRFVAHYWRGELLTRLTDWSADPRTTPAMVRRALDDVIACGALAPSDTYTLEMEYPELVRILGSVRNPGRDVPLHRLYDIFGLPDLG